MADHDGGGLIFFSQIFNISLKRLCGVIFSGVLSDSKLSDSISSNNPTSSHLQATLVYSSSRRVFNLGLSVTQELYQYTDIMQIKFAII